MALLPRWRLAWLLLLLGLSATGNGLWAQEPPPPQPQDEPEERPVHIVQNELGRAAYEAKDYERAIEHFTRALAAKEEDEVLAANLGRAIHAKARQRRVADSDAEWKLAVTELQRATRLAPKEAIFHVDLASVHRRADRPVLARNVVLIALQRWPREARLLAELARIQYELDQLGPARDSVLEAIALDPKLKPRLASFLAKIERELAVEANWFQDRRGRFTVKYDSQEYGGLGTWVLNTLDQASNLAEQRLGHRPQSRLTVVLYSRAQYDRATGAHAWTGALYDGKIRVPVRDVQRDAARVARALTHEVSHWVLRDFVSRCPVWFDEGIAQLMEGKRFDARQRARLGKLQDLPLITAGPKSWARISDTTKVRRLYAHSLGWVGHLQQSAGWPGIADTLHAMNGGSSLEEALSLVYGVGAEAIERDFRQTLR